MTNSKIPNQEMPSDLRLLYYLQACYEKDTPPPEEKKPDKKGDDSNADF